MSTSTQNETSREQVEMGKLFAEMLNLIEDTRKKEDEREKLRAEAQKMQAEALKLNAEARWHPLYKVAILWGSAFAAATVFIKFINMLPR